MTRKRRVPEPHSIRKCNAKSSDHFPRLPQWLRELATLLESGVPAADAVQKSSLHQITTGQKVVRLLQQGQSVSNALRLTLFSSTGDRILLQAAESGGFIPETLRQLARRAEQRDSRQRQFKSKLWLLYAVLVIAWLAGFVIVLFAPDGKVFSMLLVNTLICGVMLVLLRWVSALFMRDCWWWLNLLCGWGRLHYPLGQKLMAANWLLLLSRQLAAGLDAVRSLENMVGLLADEGVQRSVRYAARLAANGTSVAQALIEADLVSAPTIMGPLVAGEQSGCLADALARSAVLAENDLQETVEEYVAWMPRVLYVMVCLFVISVIL